MKHVCPICESPMEFDEFGNFIECHSEAFDEDPRAEEREIYENEY